MNNDNDELQEIFAPEPQGALDIGQARQNLMEFPLTLAERYQPRCIADCIGIPQIKRVMTTLLEKTKPCALLFVGPPGSGKDTVAMAFAEQLPGSLHHVNAQKCDVATLDALNDKFAYYPPRGRFWICLVDEADQMTAKAQLQLLSRLDGTAALKPIYGGGLERGDPPPIIWIFTCNGRGPFETQPPSGLAKRFLSRCMVMAFTAPTDAELVAYLEHIWNLETGSRTPKPDFAAMARAACNNVRDALMKLDLAVMGGVEEPSPAPLAENKPAEKAVPGIKSRLIIDMVASLTAALGQRQAETMLQLAVRDCGKRLFVDGQIGRVTIAVANRIPERQLLEALRRRAEPKGA